MRRNSKDLGASAIAETGSHASHEARSDLRPTGFDPARLTRESVEQIVAAVRAVRRGERTATGFGTPHSWAIHFGFLCEEAIKKPCPTCGVPRIDYHYTKVTPAGRAILALAGDAQ